MYIVENPRFPDGALNAYVGLLGGLTMVKHNTCFSYSRSQWSKVCHSCNRSTCSGLIAIGQPLWHWSMGVVGKVRVDCGERPRANPSRLLAAADTAAGDRVAARSRFHANPRLAT
eukprot:2373280-Amphidinium_carterae.2